MRTRTRYIALAKALVRRDGLRVPTSASAWVPMRITALDLSPALATELAPLFAVYATLNEQIAAADRRITAVAAGDPIVARLTTAPGVGRSPRARLWPRSTTCRISQSKRKGVLPCRCPVFFDHRHTTRLGFRARRTRDATDRR